MRLRTPLLAALLFAAAAAAQDNSPSAPPPEQKSPTTPPTTARGNLEVLSDTHGVDFQPYISEVLKKVRTNWYKLIPVEARPPLQKQGEVSIEFAIMPDGKIAGVRLSGQSGDVALDRAAWGGITASAPFEPLPKQFHGPFLALRLHFLYNPAKPTKAADSK